MGKRFTIESVFKAVDRVTKPISRMQNRVRKFTRSMNRGLIKVDRTVDKIKGGLKKLAIGAVAALSLFSVAMADTISTGADFEQAITNVGAVSLKTRDQIAPLEKLALKLGKTTKFTATEAAGAMEILARAGFSVNQIMEATPAVLSAAAASGLEIAEVADHVSNVLKGMGLEMDQAATVADVLALASSKTNSTIGSLGESMRNVAATARQLNIPLSDTVAAVALLQDVGLDASVAGSAFNTMLTKMAAPSAKITKIMRKFGLSFKDAKGNMLDFPKVIDQLNKAAKKAGGNFDQVAFLAELVGLRGQKAAANLAKLFEEGKLAELTALLKNAKGTADKMADIRMNTVAGSFLLLKSAIDGVKVGIFNLNSGPLKELIDNMTKWVLVNEKLITTKITDFIEKLVNNFENIVKWIKRIGAVIGILITLSLVLKAFIAVMTAVNIVLALNPIVLIVIAIIAMIGLVIAAIVWWDKLKATFQGFSTTTKASMLFLTGPFGLVIAAASKIMEAWEPVKVFFADLGEQMARFGQFSANVGTSAGNKVKSFFGFGNDEEDNKKESNQVVSPQDRVAKRIDETRTTNSSEVTIKDETGRAQVTGGRLGHGLTLTPSGAF